MLLFAKSSVIITIRVSNKNKRDEFVLKSCGKGLAKTMKCFKLLTPNFNEPVETSSLTIEFSVVKEVLTVGKHIKLCELR